MSAHAAELELLIARLGIFSSAVRAELEAEPERAVRVLSHAARLHDLGELRTPAGWAIVRFRQGYDLTGAARPRPPVGAPEPLTVAELEGALDYARRHKAPPDVLEAHVRQLELARYYQGLEREAEQRTLREVAQLEREGLLTQRSDR